MKDDERLTLSLSRGFGGGAGVEKSSRPGLGADMIAD
jgi:hypothetical protein